MKPPDLATNLLVAAALALSACSAMAPAPPARLHSATPTSLSVPDTKDPKVPRTVARELEGHLATCVHDRSCDRAHFTRALLSLSENRDLAVRHFQEVVAISPKSQLAGLSLSWLKFLQEQPGQEESTLLASTTQWLVHDSLLREQAAKEEVNSRDKKLEELSTQLEALKQIDLEMAEKSHPLKPKTKNLQTPTRSN
jgi:hypothetical protein